MTKQLSAAMIVLMTFTSCAAIAAPHVAYQVVTPSKDALIPAAQLRGIVQKAAGVIVDEGTARAIPIAEQLDACRPNEHIDRCVQDVLNINHAAIRGDMKTSRDTAYLILTARTNDGGFISGTAYFVTNDGLWTAATFKLEPLDARQRPRRGLDEMAGRTEWFAADSTYLLSGRACEVAHRLGLTNARKHISVRAYGPENGLASGTVEWPGEAIVR